MTKALRPLAVACLLAAFVAPLCADETLKTRVRVDLEAVWAAAEGVPYPLDNEAAARQALAEASYQFSAMVYGWTFEYEPGNTSRRISESFKAELRGTVAAGDPDLTVHDAARDGAQVYLWVEYRLDAAQERWRDSWRSGDSRKAQATGSAPLRSLADTAKIWEPSAPAIREAAPAGKAAALEDAARVAVLSILRTSSSNRPRLVRGEVSLQSEPRYWIDEGRWMAQARFLVRITATVPYAAF